MSDSLFIVRRDEQDQYVKLLNLEQPDVIFKLRDTFKPVLGGRQATMGTAEVRRGAIAQVAEKREQASVGGTFMVKGADADEALARAESLLAQADSAGRDRYVWWQPEGATYVSLYSLIGPASATVNYAWAQFVGGFLPIDVSWPCQPWAEEPVMDLADDWRVRQLDHSTGDTNEIHNPTAALDAARWNSDGSTASVFARTTANPVTGQPAAIEATNSGAPTGNQAIALANHTWQLDRLTGTRCKPGDVIAVRGKVTPAAVVGTTFASLQLRLRFYTADGSAIGYSTVLTGAAPVIGVEQDLAGTFIAPANALWVQFAVGINFTATPTSYTFRFGATMLTVNPRGGLVVPPYGDGDDLTHRWAGTRHLSRSVELVESKLSGYTLGAAFAPRIVQGMLELPVGGTGQKRIILTERRPWQDGWVTVKGQAKAGSTSDDYVVSPGVRYTPEDGRYFWAAVTGTNMILFEWTGAGNTTRATVAITPPAIGTSYWIRLLADGPKVEAHFFTSQPTPHSNPVAACVYNDALSIRTGYPLAHSWFADAASTAIIEHFESQPYSYRLKDTPAAIDLPAIPGTALAAADIDITGSTGDSDYPRFLLLGWRALNPGRVPGSPTNLSRRMYQQAELYFDAVGPVTSAAVAGYRSGSAARFTLTNANASGSIDLRIDPTIFDPDDFSDTVTVALFVRYYRSSTAIVAPRMRAELRQSTPNDLIAYTPEFGTTGRSLPLIGTGQRTTGLGTLVLPTTTPEQLDIRITVFWSVGTTAATTIDLDELYVVPLASSAMGATGKARDDGTYAALVPANGYTRRVRSNLSGTMTFVPNPPRAAALNMGGANIMLPPGPLGAELLIVPSAVVPDDPVTNASGIAAHNATVHVRVTPRHHLLAA